MHSLKCSLLLGIGLYGAPAGVIGRRAEDFVEHEVLPGMPSDREAPRQMIQMSREAFSDFRMVVEDMIQEGSKVVARVRMVGTHTGEFMGVPASGNKFDVAAFSSFAETR